MAKADRGQVAWIEESSYGVPPSSDLTYLRFTGESFERQANIVESDEVTSDGQIVDQILTSYRGGGDVSCEFLSTAYDTFLRASCRSSAWSSAVTVTSTAISAAASDNSINHASSGFGSIVAGQWVKVSGFATAGNNGYFKVRTATSAKLVVEGKTLVNESASPSVTVKMGAQVVNGTSFASFAFERKHNDLSNIYVHAKGQYLDGFDINLTAGEKATINFKFKGKSVENAAAAMTTGSYTAAPTTSPINVVDNCLSIMTTISGSTYAAYATRSLQMSVTNQLREQNEAAAGSPAGYNWGQLQVTGQMANYKSTSGALSKFGSHSKISLAFVLEDAAGNGYVFEIPSAKITKATAPIGGKNSDVMDDVAFAAYRDASEGVTLRITKFQ